MYIRLSESGKGKQWLLLSKQKQDGSYDSVETLAEYNLEPVKYFVEVAGREPSTPSSSPVSAVSARRADKRVQSPLLSGAYYVPPTQQKGAVRVSYDVVGVQQDRHNEEEQENDKLHTGRTLLVKVKRKLTMVM